MDNASLSGKPSEVVTSAIEDIPEALREVPELAPQSRFRQRWLILGLVGGVGALALFAGMWFAASTQRFSGAATPRANSPSPSASSFPTPSPTSNDTLLGHFAYQEAPLQELQPITADGRIKLRATAARQYQAMVAAARARGIILVSISGFRPISEQQHLFFDIKAQRGQLAIERATVSAPPGYSEHHTGYAADIGDGRVPATNLNPAFENTAAFKWLQANAARYSFEMSFPKNNSQGVSYEPWHWRFVGDRHSLETFYKARNFKPPSSDRPGS